jgi:signal transduction histidine kinase
MRWVSASLARSELAHGGFASATSRFRSSPGARHGERPRSPSTTLPPASLAGIALLAGSAAAWIGYQTSKNPAAEPAHLAVTIRVAIILALTLAGLYSQIHDIQRRMGALLILAGLYSCLWLFNGSSDSLEFAVGVLFSGCAPGLFCYLMLAYPTGRLSVRRQYFVAASAGAMVICWLVVVLTSTRLPLTTPLLHCAPRCPRNALFVGVTADAAPLLAPVIRVSWLVLTWGTAALLLRRFAYASSSVRRVLGPMVALAVAYALLLSGFVIGTEVGVDAAAAFGVAYVAIVFILPVTILAGLYVERLFMGQALARFVMLLARTPGADMEAVMGDALRDPTLKLAYLTPGLGARGDSPEMPANAPAQTAGRTSTVIEHEGHPVALVSFDTDLADGERFVRAAGEAAVLWRENERLASDLTVSMGELTASRRRLAQAGDTARRRIQRDLHDGAQQHLVSVRVKLDLALELMTVDRARGERLLVEIGDELDETVDELRSLASGVYPPVLSHYGLLEALRSASRQMSTPALVQARGIGRYPPEVEAAVYFSCMEALQNITKHAGPRANASVKLSQDGLALRFEVRDAGVGFEVHGVDPGSGIQNMRDRVEAVGGRLTLTSGSGEGTVVAGEVPVDACPSHS